MAMFEPHDDDEPAAQDAKPSARPDWLVGAHEALESEFGRPPDEEEQAPPELRSAVPTAPRKAPGPPRVNPYEGFAQSEAGRSFSSNWMEEGFGGTPVPTAPASPAHAEDHDPDPFARHDLEDAGDEAREPDAPESPDEAPVKARWSPQPAPPPAPSTPWWESLVAKATTPAGLVVLGVAAVVALTTMLLMRPKDTTVALSKIRNNVASFDGRTVTVKGRVGEVYAMGGGYSFYLLQGRDTIVVFTRSRTPVSDQRVSVRGVISTGVLNGAARQALLESSPTP